MASRPSPKFTVSFVAGLLLIPMAAVTAVALMSDAEPEAAAAGDTTTTVAAPEVRQVVFGAVGEATAEDLAQACGPAGLQLVAAEADGTISPVQQAALDALRPICEGQGMALPAKPEPPPITQTVTVRKEVTVAAPAPNPSETTSTTDTTITTDITSTTDTTSSSTQPGSGEPGDGGGGDGGGSGGGSTSSAAEQFQAVYGEAVSAIRRAVDEGGNQEKIDEARSKLATAERRAQAGRWQEATANAYEAIGAAQDALREEDD